MNSHLSKITKQTRVFFMRHAETIYNKDHLITGNKEVELSERGIDQARQTGNFFRDKDISVLLHSYLSRTKITGELVTENLEKNDILFEQCDALVEIDSGDWTHRKIVDIAKEDPHAYEEFKKHSWESVPQSEKIDSLVARCDEVWKTILRKSEEGHRNILAVSHGGFINWIFKTSLSLTGSHLETWSPIIKTDNCGIYELLIEVCDSGAFGIWKRINHICYN